jgi:hypothetical protein
MNEPVLVVELSQKLKARRITYKEAMLELARSFPCLNHKFEDWTEWDSNRLDKVSAPWSEGELHAVRFLLCVWNPGSEWRRGKFDLVTAFGCLDYENRQPIIDWASDPWWP